ncbi:MAG: hypothetical protein AAFU85_32600 [Planctomycetota bacterium]
MRLLAIGLLLGLLVGGCGSAHAQISVESIKQVCVIKPAEKIETEGSLWVVPADAELTMTPAAIVRLSGLDGYQVTSKPIVLDPNQSPSVSGLDRSTWLVSGASRVFLNVTAIDFERGLFESEVITVEVSKPEPEPEPDGDSDDDSEGDSDTDPDGDTPLVAKSVVFIEETLDRGKHPEKTDAIQKSRDAIKEMGLDYQVIDDDEPDPRWQAFIDRVKPRPAMVIVESVESIRVFEVPTSADEIETTIRRNIVR